VERAVEEYTAKHPTYEQWTRRLALLLDEVISAENIEVHQIEKRCKEISHFHEKITRPGKHYLDPLNEIHDLVGIRVIVFYRDDVAAVCSLLRREFDVNEEHSEDKLGGLPPDKFGYASSHLVLSLGSSRRSLIEYRDFATIPAEVQVRTVLQHAWASVSRKLMYNSPEESPQEEQRKLNRLSATIELIDDQFMVVRDEVRHNAAEYQQRLESGELEIELNTTSILHYLRSEDRLSSLIALSRRAGWQDSPFNDFHALQTQLEETEANHEQLIAFRQTYENYLVSTLSANFSIFVLAKITTIQQLDQIVNDADAWAESVLREIADKCIERGFHPISGPIDPITIMILYAQRETLNADIVDHLRWIEIGKTVTEHVIFGTPLPPDHPSSGLILPVRPRPAR
jgi:ppGpp synthetase/RelA/SpoT-type nucleotidyltranferase